MDGEGTYYRPIGGTIEFGEKSADALVREYMEELQVAIVIKQYIGCSENIFKVDENWGHEIIQLFIVAFKDAFYYRREIFEVIEGDKVGIAKWFPIEDFTSNRKILYPDELADRLKKIQ